jgi:RND family efflux transporter MFP subunit
LRASKFSHTVVSNGQAKALEATDIYFKSSDIIAAIYVRNGSHVRRGQALASLDTYKLGNEKKSQEAALKKAELELKDVLIGQGYDPNAQSSIPKEVMSLARVRSGLDQTRAAYDQAVRNLEEATVIAPFDGVVANLSLRPHDMAKTGEAFCRVINDGTMTVKFPIMESELSLVSVGTGIEVSPFGGTERYRGRITEINPIVDDNGQVSIKATLDNGKGLIDGMNLKVRINCTLPSERLMVPKSAVVQRSGRQVVFTYDNGKASWHYVTTGLENIDSYEIVDGLTEGCIVISGGNENLAHNSPVIANPPTVH